jgi:DNA-binding ferritin-like protein
MNKWSNYGKWRHPEKRKELMKDREEKITSDTHSNRLKDDIRTEFDKIKWMIDEYIQVQDKKIKKMTEEELQNFPQMMSSKMAAQQQLINLLYSQVVDLTMMSKIELGDDVIAEIKRLNEIINE